MPIILARIAVYIAFSVIALSTLRPPYCGVVSPCIPGVGLHR